MRLSLANFGAIVAGLTGVLRKLSDSIDGGRMVRCESADHDRDYRIAGRIGHHQSPHRTGGVVETKTSSEQILYADLIGRGLACSLKCITLLSRFCSHIVTFRFILNVSDFVRDHKSQFTGRIVKRLHQGFLEFNFVRTWRVSIHFFVVRNFNREVWHRVLLNTIWASQACCQIVHKSVHFVIGLRSAKRGAQQKQKRDVTGHGCHHFLREGSLYSLLGGGSTVRKCVAC